MIIFNQLESNVRNYCRSFPTVFKKAQGSILEDENGLKYLDFFSGAGTLNYFEFKNSSNILVLTSTTRNYFPAIRFVTNDLIEGFGFYECCGEKKISYEKIIGRIGSELKHGEKISLYDISEAVNKFLPEARFDIYKDNQSFIIKIFSPHFTCKIAEMIKKFIRELNPDINQMIEASLIEDIQVVSVTEDEITSNVKRSFLGN